MEFFDISSLDVAYRYVVKIEQRLKKKTQQFGSGNPSKQKHGKGSPKPQNKRQSKDVQSQENQSEPQTKKDNGKMKKDIEKWSNFHKSPEHNIVDCCLKQSLVAEVKAS
jgi:hypothetical protein